MSRIIPINATVHVNLGSISSIEESEFDYGTIIVMNNGDRFNTRVPKLELVNHIRAIEKEPVPTTSASQFAG